MARQNFATIEGGGTGTETENQRGRPWLKLAAQGVLLSLTLPVGIVFLVRPDMANRVTFSPFVGVFVVNLLLNLPVVPLPGTSSLGQLIVLRQAAPSSHPWLIGLAGGLGMGLGEIPPYFLGSLGRDLSRKQDAPKFLGLDKVIQKVTSGIGSLMERWDIAVVFVLAVIPNPLLEVAAVSAGAAKIPMKRFVPALVAGKIGRGLLLVAIGAPLGLL